MFKKYLIQSSIFLYLLLSAGTVYAQNANKGGYQPLTPGGQGLGLGGGNSIPSLSRLVNEFFQNGLIILGFLAVLMVTIGGIEYMGSNSVFTKSDGKKKIQAAIGGLILGLSAWLILNTINPKLLNVNIDLIEVKLSDQGSISIDGVYDPTIRDTGSDYTGGEGDRGIGPLAGGDEAQTRAELKAMGIVINNDDPSITSVEGFRSITMRGVEELTRATGGGFRLTGGTESGYHSSGTYSHENGYKVDIGLGSRSRPMNDNIDNYIRNLIGVQDPQDNSNHYATLENGQSIRARFETDHWDITFYPNDSD